MPSINFTDRANALVHDVFRDKRQVRNGDIRDTAVAPGALHELATVLEVLCDARLLDYAVHQESVRTNFCDNGDLRTSGLSVAVPFWDTLQTKLSEDAVILSNEILISCISGHGDINELCSLLQTATRTHLDGNPYPGSLDANCRLLKTLSYISQDSGIPFAGDILFDHCTSDLYAFHLFVQSYVVIAMTRLPEMVREDETAQISAPVMIAQITAKVLSTQRADGAWGLENSCPQITAFALIILTAVADLGFLAILGMDIQHAIDRGFEAILQHLETEDLSATVSPWVSFEMAKPRFLKSAYILAAAKHANDFLSRRGRKPYKTNQATYKLSKFTAAFHGMPNLSQVPAHQIKAGAIESTFYANKLKAMRNDIFPVTSTKEKNKYFDYIPIMVTVHNIIRGVYAPPVLIWDNSVISMSIFLVDEYMEGNVVSFNESELESLGLAIQRMFEVDYQLVDAASRVRTIACCSSSIGGLSSRVFDALKVFATWGDFLMSYPSLRFASLTDLLNFRVETKNYLLAHLVQLVDNKRLAAQKSANAGPAFERPSMGFALWLQYIGSVHIGAPIGLAWISACMSNKIRGKGKDCFSTVKQKIMACNANAHFGRQSRLFNDYGSVARDDNEDNLNSINFLEFFHEVDELTIKSRKADGVPGDDGTARRKEILLEAAMYERYCQWGVLEELFHELKQEGHKGARVADWLGVYFAGGEQFANMYLSKDITNSVKRE
ncbi:hypothetical protein P154DRAFT_536561 [Amniculicola lignicola CBS 123094]|uniref:Uncharacterized protein n=1 Tax=Amniculicola lignicola CBS 123094 TaxID=1392246 RepID=A0A6A5WG32_9PLEO|nr:hypothetical protein P154DRAFT_536561 [Amniculicola lignicola CBS 123094]